MQKPSFTYILFASVLALIPSTRSSAEDDKPRDLVTLTGKVIGPDGESVAGARLYMAVADIISFQRRGYGQTQETPEFLGSADAEGTFRVRATRDDVLSGQRRGAVVVALPPKGTRLGVDWSAAYLFGPDELFTAEQQRDPKFREKRAQARVLQLSRDDVPIRGRITDAKGKPLEGVRVRVRNIQQLKDNNIEGYVNVAKEDAPGVPYDDARNKFLRETFFGEHGRRDGFGELFSATTDADGRFTLTGLGSNRPMWLQIDGDEILSEQFLVRTAAGEKLGMRDGEVVLDFYPAEFTRRATLGCVIEGRSIDLDTGRAIPGVVIENMEQSLDADGFNQYRQLSNRQYLVRSGQDGSFRISGLPRGVTIRLLASSPRAPYLPRMLTVKLPENGDPMSLELKLKRGVWVNGRVVDPKSRSGVASRIYYFAFAEETSASRIPGFHGPFCEPGYCFNFAKPDGHFRIAALPGRGLIAVRALPSSKPNARDRSWLASNGQEGIQGGQGRGMWTEYRTIPTRCLVTQYHAIREIRPVESKDLNLGEVELRTGRNLAVSVVDPQGKRIEGFRYSGYRERSFFLSPNPVRECKVYGYDPTFPRRIIVWHEEKKLAGTMVLRGEQPETPVLKLQPQGTFVGRVVNDDGQPIAGIDLTVPPLLAPDSPTTISALPKPAYRTDAEGRFEIAGVAPGMKYNLIVQTPAGRKRVIIDAVAKPGEVVDLGDLKLVPLLPPNVK